MAFSDDRVSRVPLAKDAVSNCPPLTHTEMLTRLPPEIVDIVIQHSISDSCPIACVCSFLKRRETEIRGVGRCRTLEVHGAFRSYSLLLHSLQDHRLLKMCCFKQGKELLWTGVSTRAAFRSGSEDVIDSVNPGWKRMPEASIFLIARYNRADLFERWIKAGGPGCASPDIAGWMETFLKSLSGFCGDKTSMSGFVSRFMVPACVGGSIDMLTWVHGEVQRRKLSNQCGWHNMFMNEHFTRRMIHSAACSNSPEKVLDFLCCQIATSSLYRIDTIKKHVASLVLLAIGTGCSFGAIQWASGISSSSFELLESVRTDVHSNFAVFYGMDPPYEHRSMFCPRNVPMYRAVRQMSSEGGWMHTSSRVVPEMQSVHWETLRALLKRTKDTALSHTDLSVMEECCVDAVKEYICDGKGPVPRVTRALRHLLEASVSSALCVAENAMSLKAYTKMETKRRKILMNGPWSFAFEVVLRAAESRCSEVVRRATGHPTLLSTDSLGQSRVAALAKAACGSNNALIIESLFVSGVPFYHHHVEQCMKMGWIKSTRTILKINPSLATPLLGKVAVELRDQRAVGAAFDTGCFDSETEVGRQALHILSDTTNTKRRRCLPFNFSASSSA